MGKYNMAKLVKIGSIDAVKASMGFPTHEDFWVALTKVSANAHLYLQGHTASVVLYDADMRAHFFKELNEIRALLESLCYKDTRSVLDPLGAAVGRMEENTLKDGLRVFYAAMDILQKEIRDAFVPEEDVNVRQDAKPIIMAIDDTAVTLKVISESLVHRYRIIAVTNGYSALKALETKTPDLFLIDIMMPGMSGYQLVEKIRKMEKFAKTPVLFISGLDSDKHMLAAMKQGGDDYLCKPFSDAELLEKIEKYLKPEL